MLDRNQGTCETIFKREKLHFKTCWGIDSFEYHLALNEGNYHRETSCESFKKKKQLTFFEMSKQKPIFEMQFEPKGNKYVIWIKTFLCDIAFSGKENRLLIPVKIK